MKDSYETLYRKQCEEHEVTFEKMRKYELEVGTLRQLLVNEKNEHEKLRARIKQAALEWL